MFIELKDFELTGWMRRFDFNSVKVDTRINVKAVPTEQIDGDQLER